MSQWECVPAWWEFVLAFRCQGLAASNELRQASARLRQLDTRLRRWSSRVVEKLGHLLGPTISATPGAPDGCWRVAQRIRGGRTG